MAANHLGHFLLAGQPGRGIVGDLVGLAHQSEVQKNAIKETIFNLFYRDVI